MTSTMPVCGGRLQSEATDVTVELGQEIKQQLEACAERVAAALDDRTAQLPGWPASLNKSMRYSLMAGGKRVRPALVLWSCELCGGDECLAIAPAMAIECIHTFSLIHDDLPTIDNDDLRRGQPSNHRVFGDATALLAGDALMALAFEIIASDVSNAESARAMTLELASATGGAGMIGGELLDVESEEKDSDKSLVERIHAAKTARLIESACRLGGIAAGAGERDLKALTAYGHALGLAFQVADDLLDVTGTAAEVGKQTGKDAMAGKQTYPRAVGLEKSREIANAAVERAVASLEHFAGAAVERLAMLARYVVARTS
jgi:geranylgeranyl diphosphate synthase type II